jgi:hypothetical protein
LAGGSPRTPSRTIGISVWDQAGDDGGVFVTALSMRIGMVTALATVDQSSNRQRFQLASLCRQADGDAGEDARIAGREGAAVGTAAAGPATFCSGVNETRHGRPT